jgi:hypothetical protein
MIVLTKLIQSKIDYITYITGHLCLFDVEHNNEGEKEWYMCETVYNRIEFVSLRFYTLEHMCMAVTKMSVLKSSFNSWQNWNVAGICCFMQLFLKFWTLQQ